MISKHLHDQPNRNRTRSGIYSHERVVEQGPSSRPLQSVVDQVLDLPLADVIPLGRPGVAQGGFGQQPDGDALSAPLEVLPAHKQQGPIFVRSSAAALVQ